MAHPFDVWALNPFDWRHFGVFLPQTTPCRGHFFCRMALPCPTWCRPPVAAPYFSEFLRR